MFSLKIHDTVLFSRVSNEYEHSTKKKIPVKTSKKKYVLKVATGMLAM